MPDLHHQQIPLNRVTVGTLIAGTAVVLPGGIGMLTLDDEAQAKSFAATMIGMGSIAFGLAADGISSLKSEGQGTCSKISHAIYTTGAVLGVGLAGVVAGQTLSEGELPDSKSALIASAVTSGILLTGLLGQCATGIRTWRNRQDQPGDIEAGTVQQHQM